MCIGEVTAAVHRHNTCHVGFRKVKVMRVRLASEKASNSFS